MDLPTEKVGDRRRIAAALRIEYETIVGSGFYLQIDAPDLALERHVAFSKRPLKDFQQFVDRVIAAINTALAPAPVARLMRPLQTSCKSPVAHC